MMVSTRAIPCYPPNCWVLFPVVGCSWFFSRLESVSCVLLDRCVTEMNHVPKFYEAGTGPTLDNVLRLQCFLTLLVGPPSVLPIGFPGADEEELGSGTGHGLREQSSSQLVPLAFSCRRRKKRSWRSGNPVNPCESSRVNVQESGT